MMLRVCLAGVAVVLGAAVSGTIAARAEAVGGWEVSRSPNDKGICSVTHSYADKDGSRNSITFVFGKGDSGEPIMAMALGSTKWTWPVGTKLKSDVMFETAVVQKSQAWDVTADGVIVAVIPATDPLTQTISDARHMAVHFETKKDGARVFDIPNAGQAIGAVQMCRLLVK